MDAIRNCSRWNNKSVVSRINADLTVFDQQTGIVQRPTGTLYRSRLERCTPSNPLQVCTYPAKRYKRSKEISSDACEFKYFLTANPAINEAINAIVNPGMLNGPMSDQPLIDQITPLRSAANGAKPNYAESYDADPLDYDMDDIDNDPSDEDDWGSSRRKKKKKGDGPSSNSRHNRRSAVTNSVPMPPSMPSNVSMAPPVTADPRPFACHRCGAKYKSRPGLTYHRLHVHKEEQMASEMPKTLSPSLDVSTVCDLCQGTKELNKKTNIPEELVSCHDCGRSAHPSCVGFSENMLITTRKYGWQCIECKSCTFCGTSDDDDKLLFCDDCDRGFHLYCLRPPLKDAPEGNWSCHLCQSEFGDKASLPPNAK